MVLHNEQFSTLFPVKAHESIHTYDLQKGHSPQNVPWRHSLFTFPSKDQLFDSERSNVDFVDRSEKLTSASQRTVQMQKVKDEQMMIRVHTSQKEESFLRELKTADLRHFCNF